MLAVSGLKGERFGPIDLEVRKGEILGIAGAEGNGQVPFLRALAGVEPAVGSASCGGAKIDMRSPAGSLRAGVVLLSGDRRGEALFPVLSVRANATIQILRRLARVGIVLRGRERRAMAELVERLRVRMASTEQPVQSLSGGNQQKVSLVSSFLRGDVKVILAEEPTQGVDVGARFDIYEALRAKAEEGIAAVVKSSDPIELSGPVRPRHRHVAGAHRPGDPPPRARRAADRRGDRRLASGRHGGRRRERRNRPREAGLAAARPDDGADRRPRRVHGGAPVRVPEQGESQQPAPRVDAAHPRLAGPGGRAPRRRLRRLGRRPHDDVRRRRIVHAAAHDHGHRSGTGRVRPRRRGDRDRSLQCVPDPGTASAFDRGDARHAQHPRGSVPLAPLLPVGRDQHRRDQRADLGRRLRSARIRRRRRSRRARRPLPLPIADRARPARGRSRRASSRRLGMSPAARSSSHSSCAR